jgi:hypothetical protein
MDSLNTNNWLVFEDDQERAAEYADFDEQVEMSPEDAAAHHEYVKRIGDEFGFPIPAWTPTIPTRSRA